jgi:hypothetical protein
LEDDGENDSSAAPTSITDLATPRAPVPQELLKLSRCLSHLPYTYSHGDSAFNTPSKFPTLQCCSSSPSESTAMLPTLKIWQCIFYWPLALGFRTALSICQRARYLRVQHACPLAVDANNNNDAAALIDSIAEFDDISDILPSLFSCLQQGERRD